MKNIFLFIIILAAFSLNSSYAQDEPVNEEPKPVRSSAVYLNGFGNSISYALTYDTRFAKKQDGWGASIGFGAYALSGDYFMNIPFQVSYLFGKKNHFFEIGCGTTLFKANIHWIEFGNRGKNDMNLIGTLSFMYRLQMPKGFFLRVGWTPVFGQMDAMPLGDDSAGICMDGFTYFGVQPGWFGLGLGYCIQ